MESDILCDFYTITEIFFMKTKEDIQRKWNKKIGEMIKKADFKY
jgi:hypothetical protein